MNLQVEIFTGSDPAEVQERMNAWLAANKISKVDVEHVLQTAMPDGTIWITVIYERYNSPRS